MAILNRTSRDIFHRSVGAMLSAAGLIAWVGGARVSAQFAEPQQTLLYTLSGTGGEFLGYVGNAVADVDGDGRRDMILGAPYSDAGTTNGGRAYLVSGADGATLFAYTGAVPNEYLGAAVNDAGDVNNDGVTDIILGASGQPFSGNPGVAGRVSVYSGAPPYDRLWTRVGELLNDRFGAAVAGLHSDVDNDGFFDVLATAVTNDAGGLNAGRAYILSGADGSVIRTANGLAPGNLHGTGICSIADLDNDGLRDFAVGARNDGPGVRAGRAYIYSSATATVIHPLVPEASALEFGWFFMNADGDVDGDGKEDVYISDFSDTMLGGTTGRAYLFSGATGVKIRDFPGTAAGAGMGIGRMVGDVDDDGRAELFVAEWVSSQGAAQAGKGYLFAGSDGAALQTMTCTVAGTQAGFDAWGMDDLNADGREDYVLTGLGADAAAIAASHGVVYVLAGRVGLLAGDLNCDGAVSVGDIGAFVLALTDPAGYAAAFPECDIFNGDVNNDGAVTVSDIGPFVALLAG